MSELIVEFNNAEIELESEMIIKDLNLHYEVWSKGGKGPNFGVINQEEYIAFLNWLPNWFNVYFKGKFSDYLLVTLLIVLVFTFFYYKECLGLYANNSSNSFFINNSWICSISLLVTLVVD